jgi:segregation and condensation protein A
MSVDIFYHDARNIVVSTPIYEGPLDLLLQLIERAELDITKVSLAQVTDQYLDHLKHLGNLAADQLSAFLIIAAKLLQIKSEVLLPRSSANQELDEEFTEDSLVNQLLQYKRFKEIAIFLEDRDASGLHTYLRLSPVTNGFRQPHLVGVELNDLIRAAHSAFQLDLNTRKQEISNGFVPSPRISLRQKLNHIANIFQQQSKTSFRSLLDKSNSRMEIVVTFLALLELVKRHLIRVDQIGLFEEIEIEPSELWLSEFDFELEFET